MHSFNNKEIVAERLTFFPSLLVQTNHQLQLLLLDTPLASLSCQLHFY